MNPKVKGYILAAIAATTYGMNPLFALPLYKEGMDPDSVLFFRYLLAIPILAVMLKARGRSFRLKRNEVFPLIVMGLLMSVSSLTLFQSYNYMDAGIASTLLFVYPVMVAVIMAVGFREKLSVQGILCILIALCGIARHDMMRRTKKMSPGKVVSRGQHSHTRRDFSILLHLLIIGCFPDYCL